MNTNALSAPAALSPTVSPVPSPVLREGARAGRPNGFSWELADLLCSIIRATGVSDSGAAVRASLHPSTMSRWKRDVPNLAILLRSAREEFRAAQLDLILGTARSGQPSGWRAAAWLLERTFPEEYSPRARERALFREQNEEEWAGVEENTVLTPPDGPAPALSLDAGGRAPALTADGAAPALPADETAPTRVRALQNVHNSEPPSRPALTARGGSGTSPTTSSVAS